METNLNIKITAPELVDAIFNLAKALTHAQTSPTGQEGGEKMSKSKEDDESLKTTTSNATQSQSQPEGTVTFEKLQSKLIELSRDGMQGQIKALLNYYGVKKLRDLPKERYNEVLMEVEKW